MHVWAAPLLTFAAYAISLFFRGFNIEVFCIAYAVLIVACARALWAGYPAGFAIPATPLTVLLLAYWVWLAVTLVWSRVWFVGVVSFWWMSTLPVAYWLYALMPQRARTWPALAAAVLLSGLALAAAGAYQVLVLGVAPQSVFLDVNIQAALLNLIALPTAGYYLVRRVRVGKFDRPGWLLGLAFLALVYALMLTRSRGGILSFLLGAGLVLVLAWRHVPRKALASLPLIVLAAYVLAELSRSGSFTERLETLADPQSASPERLLIWQQSWELLRQSPLWGAGLGHYSLYWPLYRDPADGSAGFFVHNDYLQLWIEAGLPGLLLFLGVLAAAAWGALRAWHRRNLPVLARLEMGGLAAGVGAIAVHSLVQYNFYVIPILLLCGLMLARLQEISAAPRPLKQRILPLSGRFTPVGYRLVVLVLALLPLGYFASVWVSAYEMSRGVALAREARYEDANRALERSHRFWPDSDTPLVSHADLYRYVLAGSREAEAQRRATVFQAAQDMLAQAESRNPWRPTLFLVRAELYREARELAGPDWAAQVERAYEEALRLNPRYVNARYNYAVYLLARGDESGALRLLEAGAVFIYPDREFLVPYLALTATLRNKAGDAAGTRAMLDRIDLIQRTAAARKARERRRADDR